MVQKFISLVLLLSLSGILPAQAPRNINVAPRAGVQPRSNDNCNFAGTIRFEDFQGQSSDAFGEIIYLCFGDQLQIRHNRDEILANDPDPSTAPGIGYAFYNCRPSADFNGPDLGTIAQDPCLNKTSPIFVNGNPVEQTNGIWVAVGQPNGDLRLVNNGAIQTAFNNGDPVQFWFAPITLDNFAQNGFDNNNGNPGPCVNVNPEAAFSVVYLNRIEISDVVINSAPNGCGGSFRVNGGLPQFDPSVEYRISIIKADDPSVRGDITRNPFPNPGEEVRFFVPQPGEYVIAAGDDKNCLTTVMVDISDCQAVTLRLPFVNAMPGAEICVDVTVDNFVNVGVFQGSVAWDASVLRYTGHRNFNPALPAAQSDFQRPSPDTLSFIWFEPNFQGVTLDDGAVLFQLCFEVIGELGESSPLVFVNRPTPVEIGDGDTQNLGFILLAGQVNVSNEVLFVRIETRDIPCPNQNPNSGGFTITVAEGVTPYTVSWVRLPPEAPLTGDFVIAQSGGSFTQSGLSQGVYRITVRDNSDPDPVVQTYDIEIEEGPSLGVRLDFRSPSCFGFTDGSATAVISVDGVEAPPSAGYSFRWNATSESVPAISNIGAGTYRVTVTDPNGCFEEASGALSQPAPLRLTETVRDASCTGVADGSVTVSVAGGTPTPNGEYIFRWRDLGEFTVRESTVGNLLPGEYFVTVTDARDCPAVEESVIVGATKVLSINEAITEIACNGLPTGEIFITGSTAGVPSPDLPYTFAWTGPFATPPNNTQQTSRLVDLGPGLYSVVMTDPSGCRAEAAYTLVEPAALIITLIEKTDETCVVGNDGTATIAVSGGAEPYEYLWDNGQTSAQATGLPAGDIQVRVTDANGCPQTQPVTINAPTPPQILPIENDTLRCFNDANGVLSASANPGNAPITGYQWSNNGAGQTISGLRPGVYYISVTAADGCLSVDSALVVAPSPIVIDEIVASPPRCAGDSDGSLTVFASGGTMPYQYVWQRDGRVDTLRFNLYPGLEAGAYPLTLIDGNNCEAVTGVGIVEDPPSIVVSFVDTVAVSCFDNVCDGRATALAQYSDGGQGTFFFSWESGEADSGANASSALQLCAGFQTITVTDANQCFSVDSLNIPSPPGIDILVDAAPVTCHGDGDGRITLAISGGSPGYQILWLESGQTSNQLSNLEAGEYNAVVTDSRGCNKSQRVQIDEPAPLLLSIDNSRTADARCNGNSDGVIAVRYNEEDDINPIGPDPFTWSDNVAPASSPVAEGLPAGVYTVRIIDVKGCESSLTHSIGEPDPIIAIIPEPAPPRCFGESTLVIIDTIYGGNGTDLLDYTYMIDRSGLSFTPDQPASIFAGEHIITVEDQEGCIYEQVLNIRQPDQIRVVFEPGVVVIELGDTTSRLNPIIRSSLPIEFFEWSPETALSATNVQRPVVKALDNQQYTLRVIDVNGCEGVGRVTVQVDKNRNVYIPNAFSPNGDGPNDEFRIFACRGVRSINFARIFDRWGELITETRELLPDCSGTALWDGRRNNRDMNPGVYVYLIEVTFIDGITLLYRGDVALLR
jgi:gliding motility-associated-like protein